MQNHEHQQHHLPDNTLREIAERVSDQPDADSSARIRRRNQMLQHYIELISEYQDSRRSEDASEWSPITHTLQQDISDMPPPAELVQSIRDAGGDLPASQAVIRDNLQQMHRTTGRDTILYAGTFRQGERGPFSDAIINEDDIATFADIISKLNQEDEFPNPNPTFHTLPHGAHTEGPDSSASMEFEQLLRAISDDEKPQLDLIIHSPGGTMPATQAIVRALRGRYNRIRVFIPQRAMSAAAMLTCAADEIIMGGFASLSPTNPLVIVPTMGGQMTLPAQAVVDERNELLRRLQGPDATGEDLMSLVSQPPGLFHDSRRIIADSRLVLGGWIERYSRHPDAPTATTGQHIADWLSDYYRHLGHSSVLTIDDLRRYGLNVTHLNEYPDLLKPCVTAFQAAQVAFMLTESAKIVLCHLDDTDPATGA